MKVISTDELLKLQIDILSKVDIFCRSNSIDYTVFGGTCIGTVRHGGYIPWDDDIDIAMSRTNYERFIRVFNGAVENLNVVAPELDWNYYAPYANIVDTRTILDEGANGHHGMTLGVKIDLFPIDGVALDIDEYHNNKKKISLYWNQLYIKRVILRILWPIDRWATINIIKKRLFLFKSYSYIQKQIRNLITSHKFEESKYVDLMCYPWPTDSRCEREVFEDYEDAKFENITVSIIKRYDEYLTKAYGNYMQLPPEEKRVPHHGFTAYWKD